MIDDSSLQEKVREAIQAGSLPDRLPDEVYGGSATAGRCDVCGESMEAGLELELIFTGDCRACGRSCYVHPRCLPVFESQIQGVPRRAALAIRAANVGSVADTPERQDGT